MRTDPHPHVSHPEPDDVTAEALALARAVQSALARRRQEAERRAASAA